MSTYVKKKRGEKRNPVRIKLEQFFSFYQPYTRANFEKCIFKIISNLLYDLLSSNNLSYYDLHLLQYFEENFINQMTNNVNTPLPILQSKDCLTNTINLEINF